MRVDYEHWTEAQENLYHPGHNPTGVFPLNVAENKLCWPELRKEIEAAAKNSIPDWVAGYTSPRAHPDFCAAVAAFLSKHLFHIKMEGEQLAFSPGATGVIEMTSFLLADQGDVAAIPAPCYPVYKNDIGNMSGVERYDIVTHHDMDQLHDGPLLRTAHLEDAKNTIESSGKNLRMLILTTPDNPTGGMYSEAQLNAYADWCQGNGVHMIVNEIYGLSRIDTSHPDIAKDYQSDPHFVSFAKIMHERKSDYLHMWYAFSKDFGISGFRVGLLYSQNQELLTGYENINLSHSISNHTQWVLMQVLSKDQFISNYIALNQKRLTESYAIVVKTLRELNIPYVPARGSLFVWLDLSKYFVAITPDAENNLWLEVYKSTGILLTPGQGFGHTKRGHFRMVYPYVPANDLKVAMNRLKVFIDSKGN